MQHETVKRGGGEIGGKTAEKPQSGSFLKNCRFAEPIWDYHLCWAFFPLHRKASDYPTKTIS
jgi:hypothetical protein